MTPRTLIARQLLTSAGYQPSAIEAIMIDGKWRWDGVARQADAILAALAAAGYRVLAASEGGE